MPHLIERQKKKKHRSLTDAEVSTNLVEKLICGGDAQSVGCSVDLRDAGEGQPTSPMKVTVQVHMTHPLAVPLAVPLVEPFTVPLAWGFRLGLRLGHLALDAAMVALLQSELSLGDRAPVLQLLQLFDG